MQRGDTAGAAELARVTATLAQALGDLPTVVTMRLLQALALMNRGQVRDSDAVSRSVLALVDSLIAAERGSSAGELPSGDVAPAALPAHACFWRAEALALLARSAVSAGAVLAAL